MDTTQALLNPMTFSTDVIYNMQSYHGVYFQDILFYVIFFIIILAGAVRIAYTQDFYEIFTVFNSITISSQLQRNKSLALNRVFTWLNCVFVIATSLFYYLLADRTKLALQVGQIWLAPIVLIGVILFLIFRLGFQRVVASLFNLNKEMTLYIFNVMQLNRIAGLLLIASNLIIMFINPHFQIYSILITVLMLLSLMIYRYYLGYVIGKNRFRGGFFHFLLYICTLEIAPVAIVVKLILQRL